LVAAYPYLEVASGSIPLFLIASEARVEARNSISRLEPSMSPEPATTAAENVWTKLNLRCKAACEVDAPRVHNFTDRHDREIRTSCGDHAGCVRAARRGLDVDLLRDAEPRKEIVRKPDTAGASGDRDGFGLEQDLFESLDGTHVGFRNPCPYRYAEGYSRKIHIRSGDDPLRGDQLDEALPGEDHHVGRHAAGELRGNRLRPCSLRRTRSGRDLDAARPLEFRQQLLICATESAGYQNVQLCRRRDWPKRRGQGDE